MNKDIIRAMGFGERVRAFEDGNCPLCSKVIHPNTEFKDELSLREYEISGLCQSCQDGIFEE
jgi:hypothetical protein